MKDIAEVSADYEQARSLLGQGDLEQAQQYYEAALAQTRPRDEHALRIYWEYTLCLYKLGECATALTTIEEGLSYYPDCRELFYIRGKIYYQMGLLDQSRVCFAKYIGIKTSLLNNPEGMDESCTAYWYLSLIAAQQGKNEETLDYLKLFALQKPALPQLSVLCRLLLHYGVNKKKLIESLSVGKLTDELDLIHLLLKIEAYEDCLELINHFDRKYPLHLECLQCQLHLGRYNEVQSSIEENPSLFTADRKYPIYHCISKWLQSPRQSAGRVLVNSDHNLPYVQACLLMDRFITNYIPTSIEDPELDGGIKPIIMTVCLELFCLGASTLALDMVRHFYSGDKIDAYRELGRTAFSHGCFREAKVLLERSLLQDNEQAGDYYRLGMASANLGFYKQASEYFMQAVALQPENPIYPCLVYESLAVHAIAVLIHNSNALSDSLQLKNELLRLCTLKRKSRRLRQLIMRAEHGAEKTSDAHFEISCPVDHR